MSNKQPLPVIVIGGVYEHNFGTIGKVTIRYAWPEGVVSAYDANGDILSAHVKQLTGPVAIPCPWCGVMCDLSGSGDPETDLVEHMQKWCKQRLA